MGKKARSRAGRRMSEVLSVADTEVFTIATRGCTIRGFPLVTDNTEMYIHPPPSTKKCTEQYDGLVNTNSTHIWISYDALDIFNFNVTFEREFYCCYENFSAEINIDSVKYGKCIQFSKVIEAKHEFVRIRCYFMDDQIYDGFFLFTDLEHNAVQSYSTLNDDRYNVLILGIESMSRMNFHRTMKNTADYLHLKGAIELLGYNKLGDNSFPNLFPLLFGKSFRNIKQRCLKNNIFADNVGNCSFIWNMFKNTGYRTALGSDSLAGFLGEYEYSFTRTPTDFYLQPFMFEARHMYKDKHYNYHQCLGSTYSYKILLKYIEGVVNNLRNDRLFGIFWEESISHEDLNNPHIMDMDYLRLLLRLEERSHLDNTVLILFSDHGMRFGPIVQTQEGRLEERLPLFQVLFPDSFKRRYKKAFENFQGNIHRLTTPYDVYETLNDLANPALMEDTKIKDRSLSHNSLNRSSLFLPISDRRTCKTVGILEHWCTCYEGKKMKITNKRREIVAEFMISHINKLLNTYPKCHKLYLSRILQVTMVQKLSNRFYTVVIETAPGAGIFDGTVFSVRGHWMVSGTISRLNLYRNHTCIADDLVKMYCSCE